MEYICGVTFAPFACAGTFKKPGAKESLAMMKERTGANFVIFVPGGLQETPQSEKICFTSKATMEDDELIEMIKYAKETGLRVALKPTVNCKNGTWRAHINFLMRMFRVNRNGETGLHPIRHFSFTMRKLQNSMTVKCLLPAARW